MSFHREDLKQKAEEIIEFETGLYATDPPNGNLLQRMWDLLEEAYYEGFNDAEMRIQA